MKRLMAFTYYTKSYVILFPIIFLLFSQYYAWGSYIKVDSQTANPGERVIFTVSIGPSSKDINAFGFDINFDGQVLKLISVSKAKAVTGKFNFFDVSNPSSNLIRIGGFNLNPVRVSQPSELVTLEFQCIECKQERSSVNISKKVDDVTNWNVVNGEFLCKEDKNGQETEKEENQKIIEISNDSLQLDQGSEGFSTGQNVQPLHPSSKRNQQTVSSGGGASGGRGGADAKRFAVSDSLRSIRVPSINGTLPEDDLTGVSLDQPIKIFFNQSMDVMMTEKAFIIIPDLRGRFEWNRGLTEVTFYPYLNLTPDSLYQIYITDYAKDIYGQALDGDSDGESGGTYAFSFQTKAEQKGVEKVSSETWRPRIMRCFISCTLEGLRSGI